MDRTVVPVTKEFVLERVEEMKKTYSEVPLRIEQDYNRETEVHLSYQGRELLELLQNADDELNDLHPKDVKISFHDHTLQVFNNGEPFTRNGLLSLMYSNVSDKAKRKKHVIGYKGTGFRSILGWAESITIDSDEMHIRFTPEHSQSVLQDLFLKNNKEIGEYRAATLVFPEWLDDRPELDYTTCITIKLKDDLDIIKVLNDQLKKIDSELLLFLNRTQSLIIETDENSKKYTKAQSDNNVELSTYVNDKLESQTHWKLNTSTKSLSTQDGSRSYTISIAFKLEDDHKPKNPVLYSYFPTDILFPFPVLVHANFLLDPSRNHLIKGSDINKVIIKDIAVMLVKSARQFVGKKGTYNTLEFLLAAKQYPSDLSEYRFQSYLHEAIKNEKIFPTVNKKDVKFSDDLIFYSNGLSKYISGKDFSSFLLHTDNSEIITYINSLYEDSDFDPALNFEEACETFQNWVDQLGTVNLDSKAGKSKLEKLAYTAMHFLDFYYYFDYKLSDCPNFFINENGKFIKTGEKIYYSDSERQLTPLPEFIEYEMLNQQMYEYLSSVKTEIRNEFLQSIYNIHPYNSAELINLINSYFPSQQKIDTSSISKWHRMINWVFVNQESLKSDCSTIGICFLTRSDTFKKSSQLYSGVEYGNELTDRLISSINPDLLITDIHPIIECKTTEDEIHAFLSFLNVASSPRIFEKRVIQYPSSWSHDHIDSWLKTFLGTLKYPVRIKDSKFENKDDFYERISQIDITISFIEGLDSILQKCHTSDILEWIQSDSKLKQILYNKKEPNIHPVNVIWDKKQLSKPIDDNNNKHPYAYIYHLFTLIPWIENNGERYKIEDCLFNADNSSELSPYLIEPDISDYFKNIEGNRRKLKKDYTELFKILGVKTDFSELPIHKIYSVLSNLHTSNCAEKTARRLYDSLISSEDSKFSEENLKRDKNYLNFIKNGYVLCSTGYQAIDEAYYMAEKNMAAQILSNYNILALPTRKNSENILTRLGVKRLNIVGQLAEEPKAHIADDLLKNSFKYFLPYVLALRLSDVKADKKDEARKLRDIEIDFCSTVTVNYDGKIVNLNDYEYFQKDNRHFLLKIPESANVSMLQGKIAMAQSIASIICEGTDTTRYLAIIRELYCNNTQENRNYLVIQETNDESLIDEAKELLKFDEDTQERFISVFSSLSDREIKRSDFEEIDFDEFHSIGNSKPIISLFRKYDIDIDDFNDQSSDLKINLMPYYREELKKYKLTLAEQYKITWFNRLMNSPTENKQYLVDYFMEWDSKTFVIHNSAYYELESEIIKQAEIDISAEKIDLAKLFNRNKKKLIKLLQPSSIEVFNDFISNNVISSLIYYGEFDLLLGKYREFIYESEAEEKIAIISNPLEVENSPQLSAYGAYSTVPSVNTSSKQSSAINVGYKEKNYKKSERDTGFDGEKAVYENLLKSGDYTKVIWKSENASLAGINPEGSAGFSYDIEAITNAGGHLYIEVKASTKSITDGITFYMSEAEFSFACTHSDEYCIYYVGGLGTANPTFIVLLDVFINGVINTEAYSVSANKYMISAEVHKSDHTTV